MAKLSSKKIKNITRGNLLSALIIASLLLNFALIVGIVLFRSSNALDESLYRSAYHNLCVKNFDANLRDRVAEYGKSALQTLDMEVDCRNGEFEPYFDQAVNDFYRDKAISPTP